MLCLRYLSSLPAEREAAACHAVRARGLLGPSVSMDVVLEEGQVITFVLRTPPKISSSPSIKPTLEKAQELGVPFESRS